MLFREKLTNLIPRAQDIMSDESLEMTERYKRWEKLLYTALMQSIGKTTIKSNFRPKPSEEMKKLRKERRELKKIYEQENDKNLKPLRLHEYICKQNEVRERSVEEETERTEAQFEKMIKDGPNGFWKARKLMKTDRTGEWSVMKNEDGERSFDPEENKKIAECHYKTCTVIVRHLTTTTMTMLTKKSLF